MPTQWCVYMYTFWILVIVREGVWCIPRWSLSVSSAVRVMVDGSAVSGSPNNSENQQPPNITWYKKKKEICATQGSWLVVYCILQSDITATIFFTVCFSAATNWEQLLFEGGIYFIGEPADSNDSWTRHMRAGPLGLVDTGSSTHSLSVLL